MQNTDYAIDSLEILLQKDCLAERYAPLIAYKEKLMTGLSARGCRVKSEAQKLPDEDYFAMGLPDAETVRLLRRFLTIYDVKPQKLREIPRVTEDPAEREAFARLYCLPGVKQTRAKLYFLAGYRCLEDIACAAPEEILDRTARAIEENKLDCIVPLPKEVRTHIAVANAFTANQSSIAD